MAPLASSTELTTYVEPAEATERSSGVAGGIGLGALLILLTPLALAAWSAIGVAIYRVFS
jgi:hypothetical protein